MAKTYANFLPKHPKYIIHQKYYCTINETLLYHKGMIIEREDVSKKPLRGWEERQGYV
jgi:predicted nucleic-acid-binding protein